MRTEKIIFKLAISAEAFLAVYQGRAKNISTVAVDGRRLEFSAEKVKPFLTHDGVYGTFEMELAEAHKFVGIRRLS
ncbi:MAG: DUF2835 domain-containing protein [Cycloclasticus sp.]